MYITFRSNNFVHRNVHVHIGVCKRFCVCDVHVSLRAWVQVFVNNRRKQSLKSVYDGFILQKRTAAYFESRPLTKSAISLSTQRLYDVTTDASYDNDTFEDVSLDDVTSDGARRVKGRSERLATQQRGSRYSDRSSQATINNRANEVHEQRLAQNHLAGARCRCLLLDEDTVKYKSYVFIRHLFS